MGLTEKKKRFAQQYVVDLNGSAAAIRAGYPERSSRSRACKLLAEPEVQSYVQELQAEKAKRCEITADRVLQELGKLGFANMADYLTVDGKGIVQVNLAKMSREQAAAVQELIVEEYTERDEKGRPRAVQRIKFKLHDKRGPLGDIGKHLGMFRESQGGEDAPMPTKVVIEVVDGRKRSGD